LYKYIPMSKPYNFYIITKNYSELKGPYYVGIALCRVRSPNRQSENKGIALYNVGKMQ
jgi:hypothetical protein